MSDNPYEPGQALAKVLKSTAVQTEIDTCAAINLAAIAHELRTANLIEWQKYIGASMDLGIRERLGLPESSPGTTVNPWASP